jgi:hypothetical protein
MKLARVEMGDVRLLVFARAAVVGLEIRRPVRMNHTGEVMPHPQAIHVDS